MYIPKLRKIGQAVKEIKKLDPKTEMTDYLLFQMIYKGDIKTIKYGNAWLINLDEIYRFFKTKENKK